MYDVLIIRNGEIAIKGQNRKSFEKSLMDHLRRVLRKYSDIEVKRADGRIHIELGAHREECAKVMDLVKEVFGVVSFSPAIRVDAGYDKLAEGILKVLEYKQKQEEIRTFKMSVRRQDKSFPMRSTEMAADLGAKVLRAFDGRLRVDVHHPQLEITAEYKSDSSLIFFDKIKGPGGLPVGINGKACILLSGGIDSPVAAYLMSKRGLYIDAVHFHSFPFTNERSQDKVMEIAQHITKYTGRIRMYMVNLLPIQQAIAANCKEEFMTILSRRFMMMIAERIALREECSALVTGESLGQVASQTCEGLRATDKAVSELPVLRPLIAFDKEDIIHIAKKIGTYELSIIPEEDCCTVFLPKNPATKPSKEKVLKEEAKLDKEALIEQVMSGIEIREVKR